MNESALDVLKAAYNSLRTFTDHVGEPQWLDSDDEVLDMIANKIHEIETQNDQRKESRTIPRLVGELPDL